MSVCLGREWRAYHIRRERSVYSPKSSTVSFSSEIQGKPGFHLQKQQPQQGSSLSINRLVITRYDQEAEVSSKKHDLALCSHQNKINDVDEAVEPGSHQFCCFNPALCRWTCTGAPHGEERTPRGKLPLHLFAERKGTLYSKP